MLIKIVELCSVDYINEEDDELEDGEELLATRTLIYDSPKDTLLEAFQDYDSDNFNIDNVTWENDDFDGGCLDVIKYLSVEEVEDKFN